jgi:hypothetical protein
VAIALLEQLDEVTASNILRAYFCVFAESCMAARHGHSLRKPLPEMAQLLAYNSHSHALGPNQFPLPPREGLITG